MGFLKRLHVAIFLLAACQQAMAQTGTTDIANAWQLYQDSTFQEKIFVHTDRASYVAGELVWFKVYLVDAKNHRPANLSKLAYVDLVDSATNSVGQAKISLNEGSGEGSFLLPLNTNTGAYTLRAYTNWMKNFGSSHLFQSPIVVVNTLKDLPATAMDTTAIYDLALFPEGGNLVETLKSRVAVQVTSPNRKAAGFTGTVTDESQTVVATFNGFDYGMGTFNFTPEPGQVYTASITLPTGTLVKKKLPQAYPQGYVMRLTSDGLKNITVSIAANGVVSNLNSAVFLLAHNREHIQIAERAQLQNGQAVFTIDTALIKAGITHFTLFNADRQPVCERLFFKKPAIANVPLQLKMPATSYTPRSKVEIEMAVAENSANTTLYNLSLSVHQEDAQQAREPAAIDAYMELTSELNRDVPNPRFYLTGDAEAMDNLMLTQGWRRFRWEPFLAGSKPAFKYGLEYGGQLLNVYITNRQSGLPASNLPVYLSIPGTVYQFQVATSDSLGIARFSVQNDFGARELILQADPQAGGSYNLTLSNPFDVSTVSTQHNFLYNPTDSNNLVRQSIGMQVQQLYKPEQMQLFQLPARLDTVPFYGRPAYSYLLDAYTRFQTMEEVLREYVLPINIVQRRGALHMVIMNEPERRPFSGGELVLIDGVPVFDQQKIFSYDPLKIKKIDVITRKYFVGASLFNGIASFATYNGTYDDLPLDANAVSVDFAGLQLARTFYAPVYETAAQKQSRLPDFRNTLYWRATLPNKNGKAAVQFYASDQKGRYVAEVQGMDASGNPVFARVPFDVK